MDTARLDELADVARYSGLSANLCESLLMLKPDGDRAYLEVSVAWSRALLPQPGAPRRDVRLPQEVFDAAEALAARLRSVPAPRVDRFFGFVDELRGSPGPNESRASGEVRFTLFEQDEEVHAKADLNTDDYAEAAAAHLVGDLVGFKGIIQRLPRLNRISRVSEFQRVQLDEAGVPAEQTPDNV